MIHTISLTISVLALPFALYCLYTWFKAEEDKWITFTVGAVATVIHLINIVHGGI